MNARPQITLDTGRLENALARFPRDRGMFIDGRAVKARGETIERHSPAHGALVTRMPRGTAADAEAAIAAARTPELPFGGYGQSGLGRELGRNAVKDYTEEKTFHLHSGPRTSRWLPRG